jgi:uncharacterized membrane protein HdeD (DUF308 family)
MVDLAPGPRRSRLPPFVLANRTVAAVLGALGVVRLALRAFTDTALADATSTRALGATLLVTGAMLVTASRRATTGARRMVGSLLGTTVASLGLVKVVQPGAMLPVLASLGWPRDGIVLLVAGALFFGLSFWRARV